MDQGGCLANVVAPVPEVVPLTTGAPPTGQHVIDRSARRPERRGTPVERQLTDGTITMSQRQWDLDRVFVQNFDVSAT